jgi:peptidoglycan/LPS O-acetylase OafA/YrhL
MAVRLEVGSIPALDGVRGIAVLWVIAFHYVVLAPHADPWMEALSRAPWLDGLLHHGYLGVDLFFLLSGFLLVLPWLARAARAQPAPIAREFYRRRVLRIVPAYYVHLVLLFVAILPMLRGWMYWRPDAYVVAWNAIAHGAFLHLTSPLTSPSLGVNGALWTLAIEAQFYLVLPLVAPVFVRAPVRATLAAVVVASAWRWAAMHDLEPLVAIYLRMGAHWNWPEAGVRHLLAIQLPAYLGHFALGALLASAWWRWRERPRRAGQPAALAFTAVAGFAILVHVLGGAPAPWGELTWVLLALALAMLLLAAAFSRAGFAHGVLARGPLAFVGRISYSAYLYHLPVLLLLQKFFPGPNAALPLLYLACALLGGWISRRFVERPFLDAPRIGAIPRPWKRT